MRFRININNFHFTCSLLLQKGVYRKELIISLNSRNLQKLRCFSNWIFWKFSFYDNVKWILQSYMNQRSLQALGAISCILSAPASKKIYVFFPWFQETRVWPFGHVSGTLSDALIGKLIASAPCHPRGRVTSAGRLRHAICQVEMFRTHAIR